MIGVALRKESVDRNPLDDTSSVNVSASLSARRAWIEIQVAHQRVCHSGSLSARRAWIEIRRALGFVDPDAVALRKESVDRNLNYKKIDVKTCDSRSPQGERG